MLTLGAALMAGLLALAAALRWLSPGTPAPFVDAGKKPLKGSIAEKLFVEINGVRQGLFIKGSDARRPVLLYLHGGMPDYFLTRRHPTGWEELFTVVWWEQRGSGLSYSAGTPPETVTTDTLIADTNALTDWLCRRFGTDRIYLLAHSGGTFIGIQAAAVTPAGGIPSGYLAVRDAAMHALGIGTMREMRSLLAGLVIPSLLFREYTVGEKWRFWYAKARAGVSPVWEDLVRTDLRTSVSAVGTPAYFLHGSHDYTVNYSLARSYCDRLEAPLKGFYTFAASAHSPMFEEPDRMNRILREDVLTGSTGLADRG